MEISIETTGRTLLVMLRGRLDNFGATELQETLDAQVGESIVCAVLDMTGVDYLSSGGLRILLRLLKSLKQRGGAVALSRVQPYCRHVIEMAGFAGLMPSFDSNAAAIAFGERMVRERECLEHWNDLECVSLDCGTFRMMAGSSEASSLKILGDVRNVLYARVDASQIFSKRFSETEYSIGLGGLGDWTEDYLPILGEMITVGGAMVWLPTDGHDTPDFLVPKVDTGQITLRTAFNISIAGGFNETILFESREAGGTTLSGLYRALFGLAKERRKDFRGILALALRAQMPAVYCSGVKRAPIRDHAPANGEMITHASNKDDWFDGGLTARHRDATALICGVGADLSADLSQYDPEELNKVFYLHPENAGGKMELLHNHAVVFAPVPMAERISSLDEEVRGLVESGEFQDMRHLFDRSTISRALIGVSYIQEIRDDTQDPLKAK